MNKKLKALIVPSIFFIVAFVILIYLEVNSEITMTVI